jgi:serine/threonine protein kinase
MTNPGATSIADRGGTINWMAPELIIAEEPVPATPESDIWAFGCVCYEVSGSYSCSAVMSSAYLMVA